ncbi:carbohydrate ABC transporter permease [Clostridium sp. HCP1S3_B4]|uniref:carbohydrate ABC transporter permease n=1 Tax=unclassified Clostridium TaxID=2614128 RepID=UPI003F8C1F3D
MAVFSACTCGIYISCFDSTYYGDILFIYRLEWHRLRHIIFPLVRPAFTVSVFLTLSNSFKLYDQNLSLTSGGPGNATQMMAMNIYNTAFQKNLMGQAQAKAVILNAHRVGI